MILDQNGKEVVKEPEYKVMNKIKAACMAHQSIMDNPERFLRIYELILTFLASINVKEEENDGYFKYSYDDIEILRIEIDAINGTSNIIFSCMNEIGKLYDEEIKSGKYNFYLPLCMGYYYMIKHPLNDDIVYSYPSMIAGYLMWKTGKSLKEILAK